MTLLPPLTSLGLTQRHVGTVDLDGRPARRALLARSFPTDPDDLWDALTNPERLPRWFLPVSGDLTLGGTYHFEGNAGGTVEECEPPRRFRVSWVMGEAPSWVTVTLTPGDEGTRLELEHVGHVPDEFWERYGPSATGIGWDLGLLGLTTHLATGADHDAGAAAALLATPEGVAYLDASARAWQDADVADGTAPDVAASRTARTLAFYTGQPEPRD